MKEQIKIILEKLYDLLDGYYSVEQCIKKILSKNRYDIEIEQIYQDKEQNKIYQVRWINDKEQYQFAKIETINFIYTSEGRMKII